MVEPISVNETNFQNEVLDSVQPVLVDFTAVWCQPCKMLDPIVDQLARDWEGKVKVARLDADQNPDIMVRYSVLGIPTLILFKNGEIKARISGFQPRNKLVDKLTPHI